MFAYKIDHDLCFSVYNEAKREGSYFFYDEKEEEQLDIERTYCFRNMPPVRSKDVFLNILCEDTYYIPGIGDNTLVMMKPTPIICPIINVKRKMDLGLNIALIPL